MKLTSVMLLLALPIASSAMDTPHGTPVEDPSPHAFGVNDLVMLDRVSDPQLSSDGRYAAFSVRSTDYAANKGVNAIYVKDLDTSGSVPVKIVTSHAALEDRLRLCGAWP
jgi:hypothetical protein